MSDRCVDTGENNRSISAQPSWIAFAGGLLYALLCLPPWIPSFLSADDLRDPSWQYALHDAFVQGRQFGSEVVFTYGPFGFVTTQMYHPESYGLMVLVWMLLAAVFFTQTWKLSGRFSDRPLSRFSITAVAVRVAAIDTTAFLMTFPVLFLLDRFSVPADEQTGGLTPPRSPDGLLSFCCSWGLIAAVGLLPLTKFTFVPIVALVLSAVFFHDTARRRFPITAVAAVGVAVLLWWLARQSLPGLIDYIQSGWEISAGYESAMSLWESQPADIAIVWVSALVGILTPLLCRPSSAKGNRARSYGETVVLMALMFIGWKVTFVRYHPVKIVGFSATVFLTASFLMLIRCRAGEPVLRRCRLGLTLAALLLATTIGLAEKGTDGGPSGFSGTFLLPHDQQVAAVLSPMTNPGWRQRAHNAACREIQNRHPLPELNGAVDIVPHKLAVLLAADAVHYAPRPVWQSYCVFSPKLAERHTRHFQSPDAPEFVLFRVAPLDGRFPATEDGPVWRELLQRYELHERTGDYLILRRLKLPRTVRVVNRSSHETTWNTDLAVPSERRGLLWCRVKLSRTMTGRLAAAAYKLPTLSVQVITAGETCRFRLIPGMAASGFLLSPLVQTTEEFGELSSGAFRNQKSVTSMRFSIDSDLPVAWYDEAITVEFERLEIEPVR